MIFRLFMVAAFFAVLSGCAASDITAFSQGASRTMDSNQELSDEIARARRR